MGEWDVRHRKLRRRLCDDVEWMEFGGRATVRAVLDGFGTIDENLIEEPGGGYSALALRLFDPATALWSIWWVDGRNPVLQPPVAGRFEQGVGSFFGDDVFEKRPIRVRFLWSGISERSANWEQAFSADGGATWETNWTMAFERAG